MSFRKLLYYKYVSTSMNKWKTFIFVKPFLFSTWYQSKRLLGFLFFVSGLPGSEYCSREYFSRSVLFWTSSRDTHHSTGFPRRRRRFPSRSGHHSPPHALPRAAVFRPRAAPRAPRATAFFAVFLSFYAGDCFLPVF